MKNKEFILDRYVMNLLSEKEKTALELAIVDDPTLKADMHTHRLVVQSIQSYTEQRIDKALEQLQSQAYESHRSVIEHIELLLLQEGFFQVLENPTIKSPKKLQTNKTDTLQQIQLERKGEFEQTPSFWPNKTLLVLALLFLSALLLFCLR